MSEMSELKRQLKKMYSAYDGGLPPNVVVVCSKAAARIEALEAEVKRLKDAIDKYACCDDDCDSHSGHACSCGLFASYSD